MSLANTTYSLHSIHDNQHLANIFTETNTPSIKKNEYRIGCNTHSSTIVLRQMYVQIRSIRCESSTRLVFYETDAVFHQLIAYVSQACNDGTYNPHGQSGICSLMQYSCMTPTQYTKQFICVPLVVNFNTTSCSKRPEFLKLLVHRTN